MRNNVACMQTGPACTQLAQRLHSACTALAQHLGKASVLFGLLLGRLWAPPPPSLCTHDLKDMLLDANGAMFEMDPVANTFWGACTALAKRLRSRRPCLAHCLASCTTFCASNTNATYTHTHSRTYSRTRTHTIYKTCCFLGLVKCLHTSFSQGSGAASTVSVH